MATPITQMRLAYLVSERGGVLSNDTSNTFTVRLIHHGGIVVGSGASLAMLEAWASSVDPSIIGRA